MRVSELLVEGFGRLPDLTKGAVEGLSAEQLRWAPAPGANTVGWLVWHLTRVQDEHVTDLIDGAEQVWVTGDWAARFGLKPDPDDTGEPDPDGSTPPPGSGGGSGGDSGGGLLG